MSNKLISPGNVNVLTGLLSVYVIFHNEGIMSSREDIKGYSKNNNKGKVETHAQLIDSSFKTILFIFIYLFYFAKTRLPVFLK